ncbi:MAG: LysR family transcriptional regulator, partial [Lachnospiraceae bacterium]|nr:LysR family transcriptional regulator [Lachnospiraceae bacterium]
MNQRWLRSYIAVTECGSINKAAERLYISPQALLQQI